ncbi:MAG: hypothetical protein LQ342_001253 [Letrouitia transgressa]|nr:MAG: hypothetical protein LQ342_001253 [Letrouitia transgressa]
MAITVDPEPVWDKPNEVDEKWIQYVDENVAAKLVPRPVAWGTFVQDSDIHFFLCEFVEMTDDLPEVQASMKLLAELHKKGVSPNGKFGFQVPTLQGTIPQYTNWHNSWEDFFSSSIKAVFDMEEQMQGPDPEVQLLCAATLEKVVPRLLRPLETGGRKIQPRLIHGDIWDGNTSTNVATNSPVIYDATCIYAHNECTLLSDIRNTTLLD